MLKEEKNSEEDFLHVSINHSSSYTSVLIILLVASFGYGVGVGVGKLEWFPRDVIKQLKYQVLKLSKVEFDSFGRLISSSKQTEVACPAQNESTGVLVAFGQSNTANHAEYKFSKSELDGVVNYFNGRCYIAESPLLGATAAKAISCLYCRHLGIDYAYRLY